MADYQVTAERLETVDGSFHARGDIISLSDSEAQIALTLHAVTAVDPLQVYRLELAQVQAREQELQALIAAGVPAAAPAATQAAPTASQPTPTTQTSNTASSSSPAAAPASSSDSSSSSSTTSGGSGS